MSRSLLWGSYLKTKTRGGIIHTSHPSERPHWPTQSEENSTTSLPIPILASKRSIVFILSRTSIRDTNWLLSPLGGTHSNIFTLGFAPRLFVTPLGEAYDPLESHYRTRSAVVCWHSDRDLQNLNSAVLWLVMWWGCENFGGLLLVCVVFTWICFGYTWCEILG